MNDDEYMKLLDRAKSELPEIVEYKGRFNPPKINAFFEGNKTIITNLKEIANYLNRDFSHVLKFFTKELAAPHFVEGSRVIFIGKHSEKKLNEKLQKYIKDYVICKECGSPDTKLVKKDGIWYLKCMACQAEYPVPKI